MIGTLLKAAAYYKAPRLTFSVLHPKKAAVLKKMQWDLGHAPAPRLTAVGAAALALPLGLMIGRMGRGEGPRRNPYRRPLDSTVREGVLDNMDLDENELQ
jgi:hypothetical protein